MGSRIPYIQQIGRVLGCSSVKNRNSCAYNGYHKYICTQYYSVKTHITWLCNVCTLKPKLPCCIERYYSTSLLDIGSSWFLSDLRKEFYLLGCWIFLDVVVQTLFNWQGKMEKHLEGVMERVMRSDMTSMISMAQMPNCSMGLTV